MATQVEVNVDDVSGEIIAHTIVELLRAGAYDAWAIPIVMKKGRPAFTVCALCDPVEAERVREVMLAETGSLGIRSFAVERWPQARTVSAVEVDGHHIAVKLGAGRIKVEHDDAATAARELGLPLREVMRRAEQAAGEIER